MHLLEDHTRLSDRLNLLKHDPGMTLYRAILIHGSVGLGQLAAPVLRATGTFERLVLMATPLDREGEGIPW